jgi:hypothetical protein
MEVSEILGVNLPMVTENKIPISKKSEKVEIFHQHKRILKRNEEDEKIIPTNLQEISGPGTDLVRFFQLKPVCSLLPCSSSIDCVIRTYFLAYYSIIYRLIRYMFYS